MRNKAIMNSIWIIASKLVQSLLGIIVMMLTARYLGPSNYGLINYAASIVAFVVPIMQLGLTSILVQALINEPDREGEILGTVILLTQISAFLCIIGVISFVSIVDYGETTTIYVTALYSLILIFQSIELVQYWFQSKLISKYVSLTMLFAYIITSFYKIILLITKKSIYWFAIANSIDTVIIALVLMYIYKKLGGRRLKFSISLSKKLLHTGKFYIISSMMVTIFAQTDKIMIKWFIDNESVGYYAAAVTIAGMFNFIFSAIIDSARPMILEAKKHSLIDYESKIVILYGIIILFSLIQSLVISVFSVFFVKLFFGIEYINSASVLKIVVWYTTFSYLGAVRNIWILAEGKYSILWKLNLIGAMTNIILNYWLIPIWGINGAAVASFSTQIFTNIILGYIFEPIRYSNELMVRSLKFDWVREFIR